MENQVQEQAKKQEDVITIVGNLTNNPTLKELKSGKKVINVGIAYNKGIRNSDNEEKVYESLTLWRSEKNTEMFNMFANLEKGAYVCVVGEIKTKINVTETKTFNNRYLQIFDVKELPKREQVETTEQSEVTKISNDVVALLDEQNEVDVIAKTHNVIEVGKQVEMIETINETDDFDNLALNMSC